MLCVCPNSDHTNTLTRRCDTNFSTLQVEIRGSFQVRYASSALLERFVEPEFLYRLSPGGLPRTRVSRLGARNVDRSQAWWELLGLAAKLASCLGTGRSCLGVFWRLGQAEGDTYRARTREDRRPPQLSLVASAKVPRAAKPGAKSSRDDVMFADPFDGFRFRTGDPWGHASQGDASNALTFMGDEGSETLTSIPTTDLPMTEVDEDEAQGDSVLAFNPERGPPRRTVPPPRMPYSKGTQVVRQRPGWEAPRIPRRDSQAQVIFHLCYDVDNPHYAPECSVPFRERARIDRN